MKSVSLSPVVSAPRLRLASPLQSWRELAALAATLSLGLLLIVLLCMALDPGAPLAWIVVPVLLGGSLPLLATLPGQFTVATRFEAAHFVQTLDASLQAMGYHATGADGPRRRYQRPARLGRWKDSTVTLAVHQHAITVGGPLPALRQLQQRLAP